MRFAFLLGSGISVGAGMPSVEQISRQVFYGENVARHSDGTYGITDGNSLSVPHADNQLEAAVAFTRRLRDRAQSYFDALVTGREVNYEDVATFAGQIQDAITGEYESPSLMPLLIELQRELHVDARQLGHNAREAKNYIQDTVWWMLSKRIDGAAHLQAITDACRRVDSLDLFDLNHDQVLSTALSTEGISAEDGFGEADGEARRWTDWFDGSIRHFKLHGSIDWFRLPSPADARSGGIIFKSLTRDHNHLHNAAGGLLDVPAEERPMLLVGTFDKALSYQASIFADQHHWFHRQLRSADALVAIGYGFRDKGLNTRLIDWLLRSQDRRMVVVHGSEPALLGKARAAIAGKWDAWKNDGRLRVVEKWIEDVSWEDILAASS
jgi:hypothetical protein